jgi:hypothetical protein
MSALSPGLPFIEPLPGEFVSEKTIGGEKVSDMVTARSFVHKHGVSHRGLLIYARSPLERPIN